MQAHRRMNHTARIAPPRPARTALAVRVAPGATRRLREAPGSAGQGNGHRVSVRGGDA